MRSTDKKTIVFNMDTGTVTVNGTEYKLMKGTLGFKLLDVLYSVKRDWTGKIGWRELYKRLYKEEPFNDDFSSLYENLSNCLAQIGCEDLLGYFAEKFYISRDYELRRLGRNSFKIRDRGIVLIEFMKAQNNAISAAEIAQHIGVSKKTITNDMKELLDNGKVTTVGVGRATKYQLEVDTHY